MRRRTSGMLRVAAVLAVLFPCQTATARELWAADDGERSVEFTTALKASSLFPEASAATSLWRLRFGLDARLGPSLVVEAAYEQRTQTTPEGGNPLSSLDEVFPEARAYYRLSQLDEAIVEVDNAEGKSVYSYRHELDRALVAMHFDRAEITIGRQAVGWGRGVLFGAVDVFSPFSPLEIDREWRRGIDAVRTDLRLSDRYSLDIVGALDEDWEHSALLGRLRGLSEHGYLDTELIFGKRAEDTVYAGTFSATLGEAALHAELAFFDTPGEFYEGGLFSEDHYVAKAVLGASYTFDVGNGLTFWAEYHFSGFGSDDVRESLARLLSDSDYRARFFRGDMQILGRHALAVQTAYSFSDAWALNLAWIANPSDGSGLAMPTFNWSLSDNLTVVASAYVPYGPGPRDSGIARSEYGGLPFTAFLQVRIYD